MKMKYERAGVIIFLMLLLSIVMVHLPATVKADPSTLHVPTLSYPTITSAIAAANPGDTILVAPGTYSEEVDINKAVNVLGSGAGSTFIDGTGVPLASAGLVKITASGNVTFNGFTVENAPLDPSLNEFEILSECGPSGGRSVTYTISNNRIIGIGDTNPADLEVGFYSYDDSANVVFKYNTITNTGGNNIVFECHSGTTEISYNTLDAGVSGADSIFFMTYNGINVGALQNVSYNTFNMSTGGPFTYDNRATAISFNTPGAAYGAEDAQFTNVLIQGNTIDNLQSYRRGIGFWNGGGSGGGIIAPLVESNTMTGIAGATDSDGIDFIATGSGPIAAANATILNNWIYNCAYGVWLRNDSCAPGAQIAYNVIQNNTVGLDNTVGSSSVNAQYNYWGDPTGPYNATSNPSGLGNPVNGKVNYQPYLTTPVPPALYIITTPVNKSPSDVGTTFTETVTLSQFSHFAGFDINLTWDNSLITLTTVDYTTTLNALWGSGNWDVVVNQSGSGYYKLAAAALATSASNPKAQALFTLTFQVTTSSNFPLSTPIHFGLVKLSDDATPTPNAIPCVTVTDGLYTISGLQPDLEFNVQEWNTKTSTWYPISPPYDFVYGNIFRVEVWVSNISSNSPLTDYSVTVNFDPTQAAFINDLNESGIFGTGTVTNTTGVITVSGNGGGWSGNEGLLFAFTFQVEFSYIPAHIWKLGQTNFMTFQISIANATLSFASGTIGMSGITTSSPLSIEVGFIRGDVDCNGVVNLADISDVAYYYGEPASARLEYDLNNDGVIDIYDIVTIATNYGYGT